MISSFSLLQEEVLPAVCLVHTVFNKMKCTFKMQPTQPTALATCSNESSASVQQNTIISRSLTDDTVNVALQHAESGTEAQPPTYKRRGRCKFDSHAKKMNNPNQSFSRQIQTGQTNPSVQTPTKKNGSFSESVQLDEDEFRSASISSSECFEIVLTLSHESDSSKSLFGTQTDGEANCEDLAKEMIQQYLFEQITCFGKVETVSDGFRIHLGRWLANIVHTSGAAGLGR